MFGVVEMRIFKQIPVVAEAKNPFSLKPILKPNAVRQVDAVWLSANYVIKVGGDVPRTINNVAYTYKRSARVQSNI